MRPTGSGKYHSAGIVLPRVTKGAKVRVEAVASQHLLRRFYRITGICYSNGTYIVLTIVS
jgi:hypothetical protein